MISDKFIDDVLTMDAENDTMIHRELYGMEAVVSAEHNSDTDGGNE